MDSEAPAGRGRTLGRYILFDAFASGGMATVHFARLIGPAGFTRTVAMKRLHAQFADSPDFVRMLLDEARLTGRIRHPNVVPTIDVVLQEREVFLVMEYVHGQSFSRLLVDQQEPPDPAIVSALVTQTLLGLHTAHETRGENGEPLGIVHRDATPHNVMVDAEGMARVIDFGVAKAQSVIHTTGEGRFKGKLSYMSPEQLDGEQFDRRVDVFAASVMLWESLTRKRLFTRDSPGATVQAVLKGEVPSVQHFRPSLPASVDDVLKRGLAPNPDDRFATALEMAEAVADVLAPASQLDVARWVRQVAGDELEIRAGMLHQIESAQDFDLDEIRRSVERIMLAREVPSSVRAAPPPETGLDAADRHPAAALDEATRAAELTGSGSIELTGSGSTDQNAITSQATLPPPGRRSDSFMGVWGVLGVLAVVGVLLTVLVPSRDPVLELRTGLLRVAETNGFALEVWVQRVGAERETARRRTAGAMPLVDKNDAQTDEEGSQASGSSKPARRSGTGQSQRARAPKAQTACEPPWVLDAKGRKRFKPECF